MMDPARLLTTARTGLERELLCAAQTDVAPDEVRARVLQSVTEAFVNSAVPASANAAGSNGVSAAAGLGSRAADALFGLRPVRLQTLSAAGLLLVSIGVCMALRQPTDPRSERQVSVPQAAEPSSAPEARTDRSAAAALANTRSHADSTEFLSEHGQVAGQSLDEVESSTRMDTGERELPPDWLGAQLQLLRAARGYLESGKLERAAELLDSYEQQFPGGVVGPQIRSLRAELRQQRSGRSSVP